MMMILMGLLGVVCVVMRENFYLDFKVEFFFGDFKVFYLIQIFIIFQNNG
jgi:hypothetical protein